MTSPDRWRQLDIVPDAQVQALHLTMIGAGGIGSWAALLLAKMGVGHLHCYDPDTVEPHNVPTQLFGLAHIGEPKTESVAALCRFLAGAEASAAPMTVEADTILPRGVIVSGVDSMNARKAIWAAVANSPLRHPLYIDARMGAEVAILYAVQPFDPRQREKYQATLHSDDEAHEAPCTARATGFCGAMIGALVCRHVAAHLRAEPLPFETILDLRTLTLLHN